MGGTESQRDAMNSELDKQSQMMSQAACTALRRNFSTRRVHPPGWYTLERVQRARKLRPS